jgi:hypothetical protein
VNEGSEGSSPGLSMAVLVTDGEPASIRQRGGRLRAVAGLVSGPQSMMTRRCMRRQQWLPAAVLDAWNRGVRPVVEQSGVEAWWLPRKTRGMGLDMAAMWDNGAARPWSRWLHGLRMEEMWRAVDSAGAR